jgi:hypothetical protein
LNFRQRTKTGLVLSFFTTAGLVVLSSCAKQNTDSGDDEGKLCAVELERTSGQLAFAANSTVSYSGTIPTDCKQKTSILSGRVQINVAAQSSVSSPLISFQELKAGNRNLQFDAGSDNFLRGTYEKRFDSSFFPEWSFPWTDAPSVMTLSMGVTDPNLSAALPLKVYVDIIH